MDLKDLKKLVKNWIEESGKKQLKLFWKTKKTRKLFDEIVSTKGQY
jgi:hypothetical protein